MSLAGTDYQLVIRALRALCCVQGFAGGPLPKLPVQHSCVFTCPISDIICDAQSSFESQIEKLGGLIRLAGLRFLTMATY